MKKLAEIRCEYDKVIVRKKLTSATNARYKSWIRRYLCYCKVTGVGVSLESSKFFLMDYSSPHTKRQGYFALKFFFCNVLKYSEYLDFGQCYPIKKARVNPWKRLKKIFYYS
jgi:hypothetical protein